MCSLFGYSTTDRESNYRTLSTRAVFRIPGLEGRGCSRGQESGPLKRSKCPQITKRQCLHQQCRRKPPSHSSRSPPGPTTVGPGKNKHSHVLPLRLQASYTCDSLRRYVALPVARIMLRSAAASFQAREKAIAACSPWAESERIVIQSSPDGAEVASLSLSTSCQFAPKTSKNIKDQCIGKESTFLSEKSLEQ